MNRKLDAEVAEKVMGWKPYAPRHDHNGFDGRDITVRYEAGVGNVGSCGGLCEGVAQVEPPHYSSDPQSCAKLKARLREFGIRFYIGSLEEGWGCWEQSGRLSADSSFGKSIFLIGPEPTEELAVAMFALALAKAGFLNVVPHD
jgi:hypothetical protein